MLAGGFTLDLRYALRSLQASRSLTAVALVVLVLGIGATTAIFSVVDAVVFRPLPYASPERLVAIRQSSPAAPVPVTSQDFIDWTSQQNVFDGLAAWVPGLTGFVDQSAPEPTDVRVAKVTGGFFPVLGVAPALGITFGSDQEIANDPNVAVISDGYWRAKFGADPTVIGRSLILDNGSWRIIGVMPSSFAEPFSGRVVRSSTTASAIDMWVPYVMTAAERTRGQDRNNHLAVIARLKRGVSLKQAQAQMDQISGALTQAYPAWYKRGGQALLFNLDSWVTGSSIRTWMLMLWGAVLCVLLVACVNVANVLLARATSRSQEVAVRAALGASRWRLLRELLVEGSLLSIIGTVLAVLAAYWVVRLLRSALPGDVPHVSSIALNVRVLTMAFACSVLTALCFGLVPAAALSRQGVITSIREGGRSGTASRGRQWVRSSLVVVEVSLAVLLVAGAALFTLSFVRLMRVSEGFDYHGIIAVRVTPQEQGTTGADRTQNGLHVMEDLATQLQLLPGVAGASVLAGALPFTGEQHRIAITLPNRSEPLSSDDFPDVYYVSPDYFRTMRIAITRGRALTTDDDRTSAQPVILLNQTAVGRYFGSDEPVGQYIGLPDMRLVIGVVADIRPKGPESGVVPQAYAPLAQGPYGNGYLIVRTPNDPNSVLPEVRTRVSSAMGRRVVPAPVLLDKLFGDLVAQRQFNMVLVGMFGILALAIATTGVYGVISYLVEQRTKEIGVRIALGASSSQVIGLVLNRVLGLLTAGLLIGGLFAWSSSRMLGAFLFEVSAHDTSVFVAVALVILTVGMIAGYFPARRAALADPLRALRQE